MQLLRFNLEHLNRPMMSLQLAVRVLPLTLIVLESQDPMKSCAEMGWVRIRVTRAMVLEIDILIVNTSYQVTAGYDGLNQATAHS
jgi:hypothetical protein